MTNDEIEPYKYSKTNFRTKLNVGVNEFER